MTDIILDHGDYKVYRWTATAWRSNIYLIADKASGEAMQIDAGGKLKEITAFIKQNEFALKWIVITHKHLDHSGAAWRFRRATGAKIVSGKKDLLLSKKSVADGGKALVDGDVLRIGKIDAVVLDTPGHTRGGICLSLPGAVFTGDTLFAGGIGRTDLPGGDMRAIYDSITKKLMALPKNTAVYPGHGPPSTIGKEKKSNPFLTGKWE